MSPGDERLEEAQEWLRVASDDLRLADAAIALEPPITGLALYHAQQAAEKALKAYLVYRGRTFRFTHDLTELAREIESVDPSLLSVIRPGLDLTDFGTLYRYPGEPERPSVDQTRPWIEIARNIFAAVQGRIQTTSD